MSNFFKQVSLWIIVLIIIVMAFSQFQTAQKSGKELLESDFVAQLEAGNIKSPVRVIMGENSDVRTFKVLLKKPVNEQTTFQFQSDEFPKEWKDLLKEQGISFKTERESTLLSSLLFQIVPLLVIVGLFWFFMIRQMQGGSNKALSFGKSRARLVGQNDKSVTFKDVAGVDEAKEELQEIIEFLKEPKKFTRLGGKIPKGVLLIGPPGSGKTLLARAVAGEANVPFFSISGSDFVEMFVGVGASRVRDLFQQGQKHAPCIIFIDEIDAVGRQRGAGLGGGHDEREQTLNQLLVEMDGFNTSEGVILMAATNRPDVLDRALLRPGRFDRQVVVAHPDITGRKAILEIHIRNNGLPMSAAVDVEKLARATPGFSGADLANMVNEAALLAARQSKEIVEMKDFEDAKDRVLMGPERRSLVISTAEKQMTAYHEAGHVLVARSLPKADPIHKVTIIPRGPALGVTSMLPKEDRHCASRGYCLAALRVKMGGRAAEEVIFGEFNTGAASDLRSATEGAHAMVCEWGMSDLGPISFGSNAEVFLGRDFTRERNFSEETAASVDREIHRLIEEAYADAKSIVEKHKEALAALAEALIERETLDADEIDRIIRGAGGTELLAHHGPGPEAPEMTDEANLTTPPPLPVEPEMSAASTTDPVVSTEDATGQIVWEIPDDDAPPVVAKD